MKTMGMIGVGNTYILYQVVNEVCPFITTSWLPNLHTPTLVAFVK